MTSSRDYAIVENVDFEVNDEDNLATGDVIGADLTGRNLSFDDAIRARAGGGGSCRRPGQETDER